jgi:hypothetical protein
MPAKEQILAVVIKELPTLIGLAKLLFKRDNPEAPVPTDEEVIAAYQTALESSLAKDAAWLAAHPRQPAPPPEP